MPISTHKLSDTERQTVFEIVAGFPKQRTENPSDGSLITVCDPVRAFPSLVVGKEVIGHRLKRDEFEKYSAKLTGLVSAIQNIYTPDGAPYLLIEGVPVKDNASTTSAFLSLLGHNLLLEYPEYGQRGTLIDEISDRGKGGARPSSGNALYFGRHTDNSPHPTPPGFVNLLVIRQADQGGESMLCDARDAAAKLSTETIAVLKDQFEFPPLPGYSHLPPLRAPILEEKDGIISVRYRRDGLLNLSRAQERALDEWDAALDSCAVAVKLPADSFLICSNTQALHARTAYSGGDRLLLRTYTEYVP
jgi:hypothetical protein